MRGDSDGGRQRFVSVDSGSEGQKYLLNSMIVSDRSRLYSRCLDCCITYVHTLLFLEAVRPRTV